jgi:hypothetical protein
MLRKLLAGSIALAAVTLLSPPSANCQPARADRITIEYLDPTNPALKPLRDTLKNKKALERTRELLLPVQWPRTLRLELRDCSGEANAGSHTTH